MTWEPRVRNNVRIMVTGRVSIRVSVGNLALITLIRRMALIQWATEKNILRTCCCCYQSHKLYLQLIRVSYSLHVAIQWCHRKQSVWYVLYALVGRNFVSSVCTSKPKKPENYRYTKLKNILVPRFFQPATNRIMSERTTECCNVHLIAWTAVCLWANIPIDCNHSS